MTPQKLKFRINPEKEFDYLKMYITELNRPDFVLLPEKLKEKLKVKGFASAHKEVINLIKQEWEDNYNSDGKIKDEFKSRELSWRKVENQYFSFISKITGSPWEYSEYYCYGSVLSYVNFYSMAFGRNEILITIYDTNNPLVKIAHELFHAHQFSIFNKLGGRDYYKKFDDNFIETTLILVFTENGFPFALNRDQLIQERIDYLGEDLREDFQNLLKLWEKRKSFIDFVKNYAEFINIK